MKACIRCKKRKPITEYYVHPRMGDGHLNKCKECCRADARTRHFAIMACPKARAKERQRSRRKELRRYHERTKFDPEHWERHKAYNKVWYAANPHKKKAHSRVTAAVRDGRLVRPSYCEKCGNSGRIEAHHENYDRPLDVQWLCSGCHGITKRKAS